MNVVVLKIGGSCFSYKKEGISKLRRGYLNRLAQEVRNGLKDQNVQLVIVHGGGSITHPLLDKFDVAQKLKSGRISAKEDIFASAAIHLAMNQLNNKIVQAFQIQELPAWPFQTSANTVFNNKRLENIFLKPVEAALLHGFIPILHGDLAIDAATGSSICSGDLIACLLAQNLGAKTLLFASDVNGVYKCDSKCQLSYIRRLELNQEVLEDFSEEMRDHSGGMVGKLSYIKDYGKGMNIRIFSGLKKDLIKTAIQGGVVGTEIVVE